MKLVLMGFIIGIAKVLPGISGSVLAIRLNIYSKVINAISNFFIDIKENSLFLFKLFSGFLLATILGSKILYLIFERYEVYLIILFVILILTGLPELIKKAKSWLLVFIMTLLITLMLYIFNSFIYCCDINYFIAGIIESLSTIIPGISGTAIYINLGWYDEILLLFSKLYLLDFGKLIPFFTGFTFASLLTIKCIAVLIDRNEKLFYSFVSALTISSIILMMN